MKIDITIELVGMFCVVLFQLAAGYNQRRPSGRVENLFATCRDRIQESTVSEMIEKWGPCTSVETPLFPISVVTSRNASLASSMIEQRLTPSLRSAAATASSGLEIRFKLFPAAFRTSMGWPNYQVSLMR